MSRLVRGLLLATLAAIILWSAANHSLSLIRSQDASLHQGDFGVFAEMTRTLTSGGKLYVDYWDTKPPGLFFALSPFVMLFGNTLLAIQMGTLTFFTLFVATTAGLAHTLTHSRFAAFIATLLALMYTTRQLGPETTFVMTLFGTAATWAAVHARGRLGWLAIAGALFALGCLTKQPLVVGLPALLAFAAWKAPDRRLTAIVATFAGALIVGVVVVVWAASQDIFEAMLYRVVTISSQYVLADDGGWHFRDDSFALFRDYFLGQTWSHFQPLFVLGMISLVIPSFEKKARPLLLLLVLWFAVSFAGAAIPRGWRADYFIQTAPPLILLIALAGMVLSKHRVAVQMPFFILSILLISMHARDIAQPYSTLFETDITEQQEVVDIIERQTDSDECIWTWGTLGYFNYLTERDSCMSAALDGFMMDSTTFPIAETRKENLAEMIAARPAIFITERIWGLYPQLERYAERYMGEALLSGERYDVRRVDRSMWHEADASFGNEIRFIGYDLLPVDGPYCPGDTLTLAMTWQQISRPMRQYQMFVQLLTQDETARVAGYEGPPEDGDDRNATNTWVDSGEIRLGERFEMAIPADTAPGTYKLIVGLYDVVTTDRVPVVDASGVPIEQYAFIQQIEIEQCNV